MNVGNSVCKCVYVCVSHSEWEQIGVLVTQTLPISTAALKAEII